MRYENLIWDFDGTLFDTYPAMCADLQKTMARLGFCFTMEELLASFTVSRETVLDYCAARTGMTAVEVDRIYRAWVAEHGQPEAKPFPHVEEILRPIGFFRVKAANCIKCAQMVLSEYGGEVPRSYKDLERLPGVGRKTANIVMNAGFGIVEGIAVDTHVFRIAHKLKLSNAKDPGKTEQDLLKLIPQELWGPVNHQWILFGREVCNAKSPHCGECFLTDICPSRGK